MTETTGGVPIGGVPMTISVDLVEGGSMNDEKTMISSLGGGGGGGGGIGGNEYFSDLELHQMKLRKQASARSLNSSFDSGINEHFSDLELRQMKLRK